MTNDELLKWYGNEIGAGDDFSVKSLILSHAWHNLHHSLAPKFGVVPVNGSVAMEQLKRVFDKAKEVSDE